jgi:glycosyltransferase A (GT-A) superfamily protein (DUF2064 family)
MAALDAANEARLAAAAKAAKPLTQAEIDAKTAAVVAAGGKSTDRANRLPGETATQANARITAGYKAQVKPELTQEGAAAGATIEFVRTGAGGVGTYKEVFPIGTPIPETRTTTSGNVYDAQGNLVSGSGLKSTQTASTGKVLKFGDPGYVLKPGDPGYVAPSGDGVPTKPVGTPDAYVYDSVSKTWKMPTKPTAEGNWVFDPNNGWVDTTVNPGSTGFRADGTKTLALDTFRNTLALLFGAKEASQPWVTALYTSASKFYNSGSTTDEAINLSLQDVRFNKDLKPFTDRFNGIYALTDRLAKGEAINVPTVAEYFKSESAMGDVLRSAGMGELATQDFLGGIIGLGKSVLEVTTLITDTFDRIDNAPSALKADLQAAFPGADRTSIAKAMLLGDKGAAELTKKVKAISVQSAAKTQGVTIDTLTSEDIAGQGYDYNKSLTNFATVKQLERGATLGRMSNIDLTQQEAIASAFGSNAAADEKIRRIAEEEKNRFAQTSGKLASRNRAQGAI